jgi:APA family basic amino acid/polyamine antiporter
VIPLGAIAGCLWLMSSLPFATWMRFILWLGAGLVIYFVYGFRHSRAAAAAAAATASPAS